MVTNICWHKNKENEFWWCSREEEGKERKRKEIERGIEGVGF